MRADAVEGAFERAAERREQLAAVVRAFDARRHHDLMTGARMVLERHRPLDSGPMRGDLVEVVTVEGGRLVTSHLEGVGASAPTLAVVVPADVPVGREEADLLRRWMTSDGVRVRHVEGTVASRLAGGALLATLREELRAADRSERQDDILLTRAKVRSRGGALTTDRGRPST
jgi:hypothetical protein